MNKKQKVFKLNFTCKEYAMYRIGHKKIGTAQ